MVCMVISRRDLSRFTRMAGRVVAALLLAVVLAEIGLRVLRGQSDFLKAVLHARPDGGLYDRLDSVEALLAASPFTPRPFANWGGFKLNSQGFRTAEYTRTKPEGVYRIVAMGDSFTSDSGFVPLDRLWHYLVGAHMRARHGRPVEVVNLGVPGVGPRFTLRLFEVEGHHLAPDLVLFGLFVGNDLTDDAVAGAPTHGSLLERRSVLWRLATRIGVLLRNATGIAEEQRRQGAGMQGLLSGPGGYQLPSYIYDRDRALATIADLVRIERNRVRLFDVRHRAEVERQITDVVACVVAFDQSVRAADARLVVVVIPDLLQVDATVRAAVTATDAAYDFDWIQSALRTRLTDAGVAAVDVLPALRAAPASPRLYRLHDTHWSDVGNAIAAVEIAVFLDALPGVAGAIGIDETASGRSR